MATAKVAASAVLEDMRAWGCPCGATFGFYREPSFCPYCGQSLSADTCGQAQRDKAVVIFADKINSRIKELHEKLKTQRKAAIDAKTISASEMAWTSTYRLEGNIGALEWVLRL